VACCVRGRCFDLLVIPGEGHGAGRTTGPVDYGSRRQYDFFVRNLLGIEPPDMNKMAPPATANSGRQ